MNLFILKYCLLIGGILASTALVAGPLNPQVIFSSQQGGEDTGNVSADAIYQFGSDVFYREINKPGNEYLKAGVSGYATNFVPTDAQAQQYSDQWVQGVSAFKDGYNGCIDAYFTLPEIPALTTIQEKTAICDNFKLSNEKLAKAIDYFTLAKSSSTASSAHGFEVGMVLERAGPIQQDAEDAEIGCMKAVLADQAGNASEFENELRATGADIADMKRIYPELGVLSSDFN